MKVLNKCPIHTFPKFPFKHADVQLFSRGKMLQIVGIW